MKNKASKGGFKMFVTIPEEIINIGNERLIELYIHLSNKRCRDGTICFYMESLLAASGYSIRSNSSSADYYKSFIKCINLLNDMNYIKGELPKFSLKTPIEVLYTEKFDSTGQYGYLTDELITLIRNNCKNHKTTWIASWLALQSENNECVTSYDYFVIMLDSDYRTIKATLNEMQKQDIISYEETEDGNIIIKKNMDLFLESEVADAR